MCLFTGDTSVPDIDLLGRFVSSGNLGELTHVSNTPSPGLLSVDPVKTGGLAFLDLLYFMLLMAVTEWTICAEFCWHLHYSGLSLSIEYLHH